MQFIKTRDVKNPERNVAENAGIDIYIPNKTPEFVEALLAKNPGFETNKELLNENCITIKIPYSTAIKVDYGTNPEIYKVFKNLSKNQQKQIKETEDFIERFRYKPTKSNQVQSRIKQLDKIERIEVDEIDSSRLNLKFPPAPRSGSYPVVMEKK